MIRTAALAIAPLGSDLLVPGPALGACDDCLAGPDSDCLPGCSALATDLDEFGFAVVLGL